MSSKTPSVLALYRKLKRWSPDGWLFTRAICFKTPYFASIKPRITALEPGLCRATLKQRRAVQNHIGTVHAIALCNLAELTAGMVSEASLPTSMRWIPKGMTVEYVAKARGRMNAEAKPAIPAVESADAYELPIDVRITDTAGTEVFRASVRMWASPRR